MGLLVGVVRLFRCRLQTGMLSHCRATNAIPMLPIVLAACALLQWLRTLAACICGWCCCFVVLLVGVVKMVLSRTFLLCWHGWVVCWLGQSCVGCARHI
jgi:hypothetical protein